MLNRRHIRLKIMQYLYAAEISDFEDTKQHYKNLSNSIHSIHDLYLLEISLLIEIFKKAVNKYKISHESISGNVVEIYSNEKSKGLKRSLTASTSLVSPFLSKTHLFQLIRVPTFIALQITWIYIYSNM